MFSNKKELQDHVRISQEQESMNTDKLQEIKDGQYVELSAIAQYFF
ncbi:manganese catalase family protein [Halobacillus shinanisalinarum]|uniref:Manganese catalase family protein n=1 Tax=Halobacillus shinanisalinarum TaxID=2932258 RepID=A0ABY4GUI0_9BACI|nr:manganese catalase family protein [Halobacillus shinanisalinarum]UOQ91684.1 manganese catalase family protein [Halobacillus shinanisalinarum]